MAGATVEACVRRAGVVVLALLVACLTTDRATSQPPNPPAVTSMFPRDGAVDIAWSPPGTGARGITEYVVTASPGGRTASAGSSARHVIVDGLTNGTAYRFTVRAVDENAASEPSAPSESVAPVPAQVPMSPIALVAVPRNGSMVVRWAAPDDGGSPITGYTVTAQPDNHTVSTTPDATRATVTGLDNGTGYSVSVVATNKAGDGEPATQDGIVPKTAVVPTAPAELSAASAGHGTVKLRWTPPGDTGTSAITGYHVTVRPEAGTVEVSGTSATVTGLDNTTDYAFTVAAINAAGTGPASQATDPITPNLVYKQKPVVLTAASAATLRAAHKDGTLIFDNTTGQVKAVKPGDIISIPVTKNAPYGLLKSVSSISERGSFTILKTTTASLSDVYSAGEFSITSQ